MGKPDFCPYDGKKINYKNLAYEIAYPVDWNWERIKKETVISTKSRSYIKKESDGRRFLLANKNIDGICGLKLLTEYLSSGIDIDERPGVSHYERSLKEMYSMKIDMPYRGETKTSCNDFDRNTPKKLHVVIQNGISVFLDEGENAVMYALPCCPYCHRRLPLGWETTDDFIGLAVRGAAGSGKTTFLYSLAYDKAELYEKIGYQNGSRITITHDSYPEQSMKTEIEQRKKHLTAMCCENGSCPAPGETLPLFLNVLMEKGSVTKHMIVGIYDVSSKIPAGLYIALAENNETGSLPLQLEDKLYADLFMFDPRTIDCMKTRRRNRSNRACFVKCNVLSLEEQAGMQRAYKNKRIKASEILTEKEPTEELEKGKVSDTLQLYRQFMRFKRIEQRQHLKQMRFLGIITKSDLVNQNDLMPERVLYQQVGFEDEEYRHLKEDYGLGVSWHSISALGCDAFEYDHLLGNYNPVRVDEPIRICIEHRLIENGWL